VDTKEEGWEIVDEVNLVRNEEKWRAVENMVRNIRFAQQM